MYRDLRLEMTSLSLEIWIVPEPATRPITFPPSGPVSRFVFTD